MAQTSTHRPAILNLFSAVADVFSGIYDALIRMGEANAKVIKIKQLSELTDEELAARGMKREDIVRLVMAGVY
ncbi:DUF1127 domain-containing protein [Ruegeria arenilitoris]|uniref:DUF1127 domain-containing protein n=1 Tax=Ruegeria arenilitoris TaxID=1173585 RepID=UPI00147A1205|nr:DUF1127 domain-containing protein [Ruegeria arenilitoris]